MAIVGTRTEYMRDGNVDVAVKTEQVLDTRTGLVAERKTVVAAVPTEDGNVALIKGQKTTVTAPAQVQQPRHVIVHTRAIEAPPPVTRSQPPQEVHRAAPPANTTSDGGNAGVHICCFLLSIFFPPCILCWMLYCCCKT